MKKQNIILICGLFFTLSLSQLILATEVNTENISNQNQHVYFGILAGGSGERLWPLSSAQMPKQLLPFVNGKTLLEETIDRINELSIDQNHIFIVTRTEQVPLIQQKISSNKIGFFIEEPCGRNTAPAILLSCREIIKKDQNAVIVFLPVDHFIPDANTFRKILQDAIDYAKTSSKLCILGLKPTYAATGYGYIQADFNKQESTANFFAVKQFCEKPEKARAQQFVKQNDMFWNLGIVIASASNLINEFTKYLPNLNNAMNEFLDGKITYNQLPSVCVSRNLLEKTSNIAVHPASFEWYDVGNVDVFLTLQARYSSSSSNIINISGKNNLMFGSNKKVVCVGVNNIRIIEANGVLLIVDQDHAEKVNPRICQSQS